MTGDHDRSSQQMELDHRTKLYTFKKFNKIYQKNYKKISTRVIHTVVVQ